MQREEFIFFQLYLLGDVVAVDVFAAVAVLDPFGSFADIIECAGLADESSLGHGMYLLRLI